MRIKHQRGFTWIELAIVLIIVGMLAVIAIPKMIDIASDSKPAAAHKK